VIKPEDIPRFTGNLEVLEKAVGALDADGSGFTSTGSDIHSRFQSLTSYYEAPEAEKLFATTAAVQTTGENLGTDVESVARALGEYANEIRPLVARLETLRSEATAFVAEAKADDNLLMGWQRDRDKIDKNEELVNGVTATTTAFWEAERTAANKIMALFSCVRYRANDGSNKPDMYGYSADALKDAELPWGTVEERSYLPGNIDRHIKSFVWDGLIVDNIWGTIQGLGALVGIGADASDTWAALGRVFLGAGDFAQDPLSNRPGGLGDTPFVQESRKDAKEFAKGLVAWDMWSENPARASATVVFNVLTLGVGPLKAGTAAKAGLGAKAAGTAAKIGELLDPVSATVKAAGAAAPKIAEITAGLRKSVPDLPDLAEGSVRLPDGSLLNTIDGELIITRPDGSLAGKAPGEMSAADRAALDGASHTPERTPANVGALPHASGGTAHAGDGLPPQASRDLSGSGSNGTGGDRSGADGRGSGPTDPNEIMRRQVDRANNEPGYFEKYFKVNGNRLSTKVPDESGLVPPQLVKDPATGNWISASDAPPPLPEKYVGGELKRGRDTVLTPEALNTLDNAAQTRRSAIVDDQLAEKNLSDARDALKANNSPANEGAVAAADAAHKPLHDHMTKSTEAYGEAIAEHHVIPEHYPSSTRETLDGPKNGNDQFDQVWQREDGGFVVVEAKSSTGTPLGSRKLPNGVQVSQGTREYFDDILREMRKRGRDNPNELRLANKLNKALKAGKLDYILVKGNPNTGQYNGYTTRKFDVG
jgi:hypothetical protein